MRAFLFPGQGSQKKGMGAELFDRFPERCAAADEILGFPLRELCLRDPDRRLSRTENAQPALFVVNALAYLARIEDGGRPDFVAGHSLGEYDALFAAGCFDFETGVRLVRQRGELMAEAAGGAMVAVVGPTAERVEGWIAESGVGGVEIANYNSPTQVVLSGAEDALSELVERIRHEDGVRCLPLDVSAAFHSRQMERAAADFARHLDAVPFAAPRIPVIANVTGRPYPPGGVRDLLAEQIRRPVRWWESLRYLIARGVREVEEIGPGRVLTKLWRQAVEAAPEPRATTEIPSAQVPAIAPESLGSADFRRDYRIRYAYLAGSMYRGIASAELVIRMGRAGLMGFFGTGGLELAEVEAAIRQLRRELPAGANFGMNLLHPPDDPQLEAATVELFLRHDVRFVEAAAYLQMTPPLVRFRFRGAHLDGAGEPVAVRRVVAKVSRPEIAEAFMSPPPEAILRRLVAAGELTPAEAETARRLPVSQDVCVEADSGGHTDAGRPYTLMPAILRLRDEVAARHRYRRPIRIGAAGGIGSPEAAAAAFVLGADFLVTGSINQCSPEAGTSDAVKELLATLDVQDTAYAPAGDLFELDARVQVARRGTLFAARANKLHQLYRRHPSLDHIDPETRRRIEEKYFKRSFDEVWRDARDHLARERPDELERVERDPKRKMAWVFRWYFAHTTRAAVAGDPAERANYQIHTSPAIGAFNRFVRGSELESWRNRHVDRIAERLMAATADLLTHRLRALAAPPGGPPDGAQN